MERKKNDIEQFSEIDIVNPSIDSYSLYMYFFYVYERLRIQMKRESGERYPWTDVPILRDNSFTNNRRIDDRTTKWLINNISNNPDLSLSERVWRTILFRLYNKIETAEIISLTDPDFWDKAEYNADILDIHRGDVFTRAYNTISIKYRYKDKYESTHNWRSWTLLGIRDTREKFGCEVPDDLMYTAEFSYNWIKSNIQGAGRFIGFQILIDLMYINEIPYSNNSFVICGPGAITGLDRIFNDKIGKDEYEKYIYYMRDHYDDLYIEAQTFSKLATSRTMNYRGLPPMNDFTRYIRAVHGDKNAYCVTDIQNTLCEYSKFMYLCEGRHKRPRKYLYSNGGDNK